MGRILVVEDYPPLATVVTMALKRRGHEVVRLDRVRAAMEHVESFDGAILDVDLADGNGVDLAERLHDDGRVGWITFFTANRSPEVLERAKKLGPVVDKTFGLNELLDVLDRSFFVEAKVVGDPNGVRTKPITRSGTRRRVR